jgi:hypothetical protein
MDSTLSAKGHSMLIPPLHPVPPLTTFSVVNSFLIINPFTDVSSPEDQEVSCAFRPENGTCPGEGNLSLI